VTKTANKSLEDTFKLFYSQTEDLRPKRSRKWRNHEARASHAASHACGGAWKHSSNPPRPPPRVWKDSGKRVARRVETPVLALKYVARKLSILPLFCSPYIRLIISDLWRRRRHPTIFRSSFLFLISSPLGRKTYTPP